MRGVRRGIGAHVCMGAWVAIGFFFAPTGLDNYTCSRVLGISQGLQEVSVTPNGMPVRVGFWVLCVPFVEVLSSPVVPCRPRLSSPVFLCRPLSSSYFQN